MLSTPVRMVEPEVGDEGSSQAVKAQQRLREWILAGELPVGTRIAESVSYTHLTLPTILRV